MHSNLRDLSLQFSANWSAWKWGIQEKKLLLALYTEWYLQALFCNSVLCNTSNANIWIVKKSEQENKESRYWPLNHRWRCYFVRKIWRKSNHWPRNYTFYCSCSFISWVVVEVKILVMYQKRDQKCKQQPHVTLYIHTHTYIYLYIVSVKTPKCRSI